MKFEYTGRHVEVSPAIRRHVEDHFKKLDHVFNGDSTLSTHVIIDVEKNRQIGEIVVYWRDYTLTAKDTNADMYMALTRAMAKIEKQAVKLKKKLIEEEDSHNPITDDQVVKILAKDGIKLSRRTVAKYRDQMQIPGSRERRAVV